MYLIKCANKKTVYMLPHATLLCNFQNTVNFVYLKIYQSPKKLPGKKQEVLAKGRNILVEPVTSGLKFLVEPRSLKMDTVPGTGKMKIIQTGYLTRNPSLVGSWLRPEDFGFGYPLSHEQVKTTIPGGCWVPQSCSNKTIPAQLSWSLGLC